MSSISNDSYELLKQLADASPDLVYTLDTRGRFMFLNRPLEKLFGAAPNALIGKTREACLPPAIAAMHHANDQQVIASGKALHFEELNEEAGSIVVYETRKFPLTNSVGEIVGIGGISRNITATRLAERALLGSERRYETLANIAPAGIFHTDSKGACLYVSDQWCKLAGMAATDALGDGWVRALHPDDRERVFQEWKQSTAEQRVLSLEYRFQRTDGSVVWLYGQSAEMFDIQGELTGYVGVVTDISALHATEESLAAANEHISELAAQYMENLERERHQISQELHDEIGQMLTALKLMLKKAMRISMAETDHHKTGLALEQATDVVDALMTTVRDIARQLRPPQLDDLGLASSLRWQIANLTCPEEVAIDLEENVGDRRFAANVELAIFRIAQEAITNALRHANARRIKVSLTQGQRCLALSVHDDGSGMLHDVAASHTLGLLGMRERAESFGGRLNIESTLGQGTSIEAVFKLQDTTL